MNFSHFLNEKIFEKIYPACKELMISSFHKGSVSCWIAVLVGGVNGVSSVAIKAVSRAD